MNTQEAANLLALRSLPNDDSDADAESDSQYQDSSDQETRLDISHESDSDDSEVDEIVDSIDRVVAMSMERTEHDDDDPNLDKTSKAGLIRFFYLYYYNLFIFLLHYFFFIF